MDTPVHSVFKGARVLDPINGIDAHLDIIVSGSRIAGLVEPGNPDQWPNPHTVIDAQGLVAFPGLVDMHVHLREPGQEHKETIETGTLAAVRGGFTAVCCMPNTSPTNDSLEVLQGILDESLRNGHCRVFPACAITKGLAGEELVDFQALKDLGAAAFTDDGMPVLDPAMMKQAMVRAKALGVPILSHCEEIPLVAGGVMNLGPVARELGYPGISNVSESAMVERDIALCRDTGVSLHICHVSTRESVDALRAAKAQGISVTAETAPHYFTLTDERVKAVGANAKMNPPLRSEEDRQAIRQALADGTIDAIATDHAPHAPEEKDQAFPQAPNGIVGLETSLPLSLALVRDQVLSLQELVMKMSVNPARILGLDPQGIVKGAPADITFIDMDKSLVVNPSDFASKSRNTPFAGMEMTGLAMITVVDGVIEHQY